MKDPSERICLIGFMGAGKTTVGRLLAQRLGYRFVDLDELIEQQAGMAIPRIFQQEGETGFRARESACLASLQEESRVVIAAGGGAPIAGSNRDFFARQSATFFLSVSLETALSRAPRNGQRPMLEKGQEEVRRLFETRLPIYLSVGTAIEAEGKRPAEIIKEIMIRLGSPTAAPDSEGSG